MAEERIQHTEDIGSLFSRIQAGAQALWPLWAGDRIPTSEFFYMPKPCALSPMPYTSNLPTAGILGPSI